jgi:hypothetical protein
MVLPWCACRGLFSLRFFNDNVYQISQGRLALHLRVVRRPLQPAVVKSRSAIFLLQDGMTNALSDIELPHRLITNSLPLRSTTVQTLGAAVMKPK